MDSGRIAAVVDADESQVAVWWVRIDPGAMATARQCGAWVLPRTDAKTIESLVLSKRCLLTVAGFEAMESLGIDVARAINVVPTVAAVAAELATMVEEFEAEQATRKPSSRLLEPDWPAIPEPLDPTDPPRADSPPPTEVALGVARWLGSLAESWDELEELRLRRRPLWRSRGDVIRAMPISTE